MSTEFISFLPPPGAALANYNRKALHSDQPSSIPATFKEAMSVREQVFVDEQHCSLENEVDEDDPRSFHWVVYASVGTTSSPSAPMNTSPTATKAEERRVSESTASRVPVGTIRLVPPPHQPHFAVDVENSIVDRADPTTTARSDSKTPTHFRETSEPYVKLGRIATIAPYRGLGLSKLLFNAAVNWASAHPEDIIAPMSPADLEAAKLEGKKEPEPWQGLVLVHAQKQVQKLWERFGFKIDNEMGSWDEEGIEHVGLWKRIEVKGADPWKSLSVA
jgi:predicted GNAT family N-acyltransferase